MRHDDRLDLMRRAIERDERRASKRRRSDFMRALVLVGSVGWPIGLLTAAGALVGPLVDRRLHTGVAFTIGLLVAGAVVGSLLAMRTLREHGDPGDDARD